MPPFSARRSSRGRLAALLCALALVRPLAACEGIGPPARVHVPVDSAAGEVPFRLAGPGGGAAIVVRALINGRDSVDLIVDTGATLTCIDDRFARALRLPERRGAIASGIGVGGSGRVRLVRVDSLRVGGASAADLTACTLDLAALDRVTPGARGLLGLNFLRSFRVTLDFGREVLLLAPAQ